MAVFAAACGTSSSEHPSLIDATPSSTDTSPPDVPSIDATDETPDGCPIDRPVDGSACSIPKTSRCSYADPCPNAPTQGATDIFQCIDHIWTVPPAGTYAIPCPTPMPSPGDPCLCAAHMPTGCIVSVCADLAPDAYLICDDATKSWRAQSVPCNPPPPDADVDGDDSDADAF